MKLNTFLFGNGTTFEGSILCKVANVIVCKDKDNKVYMLSRLSLDPSDKYSIQNDR